MKKPTEKDRERIAAAVERLFAFYTRGADMSAEKQQYVVSRCICRLSDEAVQESARRDLDRFVLETIFLECISEATRVVHTPKGDLIAYPKHAREDHKDSYPGIFVDLIHADGERTMLSCIEYDSSENRLQAVSYGNAYSDEPTEITKFDHVYSDSEIEEKLKELIDKDVVTVMMQGSEKMVKVEGYCYDSGEDNEYRGIEFHHLILPLSVFVEKIKDGMNSDQLNDQFNMGRSTAVIEYTARECVEDFYGDTPVLPLSQLTEQTPCGTYIIDVVIDIDELK